MSITLETRDNGRVQAYNFKDPWAIRDLLVLFEQDMAYRDSVNFPVHAVVDCTETTIIPPGVFEVHRAVPIIHHMTGGILVLVGLSAIQRAFANTMLRLVGFRRVKFFDHVDDGWTYIRSVMAEEPSTAAVN